MVRDAQSRVLTGVAVLVAALLVTTCARPQPDGAAALAQSRSPHGAGTLACASCHQPGGWSPLREDVDFDHSGTSFQLSGQHSAVDCRSCHLTLRFDEPHVAEGECATCHVDVHGGSLGTSCTSCHDTKSFAASGRRDAHAGTSFPLTGRHRQVECEACHGTGSADRFTPLPTECFSCHADDYRAASPEHETAGFRTTCESCHGVLTWRGARFEHARETGYPLEGAHIRIACQSCHAPPDFALIYATTGPRDCIACHQDDYDRVHPSFGFAADCLQCHTLQTFRGAVWADHDARFPIYSGAHRGRWSACTQCHDGQGLSTVSCLNCHEHSQARMDDKHRERSGYTYTTPACLSCHPRGDA
ncbi:MAG TPA: hypothetical protein VFZ24_05940 [Longimicrobiales bacterium]